MENETIVTLAASQDSNASQAQVWYNQGNALRDSKCYEQALLAYKQALIVDPTAAIVWYSQGNLFYFLKRYQEALVAYEQAVVIDPQYIDAWVNKARVSRALIHACQVEVDERRSQALD